MSWSRAAKQSALLNTCPNLSAGSDDRERTRAWHLGTFVNWLGLRGSGKAKARLTSHSRPSRSRQTGAGQGREPANTPQHESADAESHPPRRLSAARTVSLYTSQPCKNKTPPPPTLPQAMTARCPRAEFPGLTSKPAGIDRMEAPATQTSVFDLHRYQADST